MISVTIGRDQSWPVYFGIVDVRTQVIAYDKREIKAKLGIQFCVG